MEQESGGQEALGQAEDWSAIPKGRAAAEGRVVQVGVSPGGVPKISVAEAFLGPEGLSGDNHDNKARHGGPDRALCLYALELIEGLRAEGHRVAPGDLGENVTLKGIPFGSLAPGDLLRIGQATVQLTRPTAPCRTIAHCFRDRDFSRILATRFPGWSRYYARVLTPGTIRQGDPVHWFSMSRE